MSAGAPPGSGSLLSATDFFGKTDAGGVEKFKTVAFRALHEQKLEEELQQTKLENERLKDANVRVTRDFQELQASFDANIDDRERVLAFKSKRIEELHSKLREYEAINASLLQTINGSGTADVDTSSVNSAATSSPSAEPAGTETETRARMMTLINTGRPLFHALDTCKEQEYKQLHEAYQRQCEHLIQTALENEAVVRETRLAQFNKQESDAQIKQLQTQLAAMALEKDELGHHLERKLILENDRLRREKEAELQAFHDAMRTQMRMQLDVTTQRTVEENERVQLELRYQSSQLEKMMKQIDELRAENKRSKHEMHVFEEMNTGLSKKLKFYEQLFAKMQHKDEQRAKAESNQPPRTPKSPLGPPSSRRTPRKPPLPTLSSVHHSKSTSPETPSLYGIGSPHASCFSPDVDTLQSARFPEFDLDTDDGQSPYPLNSITDVLEKHLQSREFTKKQVVAVLRYHQDQYHRRESPKVVRGATRLGATPVLKKKLMLSKACYSPTSYGRKIREPPMTLDALIKQKASTTISSDNNTSDPAVDNQQRQILHSLLLPELSKKKAKNSQAPSLVAQEPSDMWRSSATQRQLGMQVNDQPATARF
ncbi:hypothetical protein PF005_g7051 [Phytophthora fragariae]|uniref:Cilia- and flagella-associated protein 157 n=1 Tax=Phytophthora fragariae TaxID=53985 RepID=A0A6A3ZW62_9STRA|nr:hypothetical protein PF003_g9019 [Phytophthora fragariae]KAE8942263.1 hypothetical protein PF009_g7966 [Phytophthora fragariae]KAE9019180.1 hypothetical protein PF011_g5938 [Phytophthora fragariae]KAE9122969.1 hypothetical protein PF007_g7229 [Phytophthora fragariae]KAE9123555.1 hypothetical protein PF010_g6348 [Phytophthora fragariae]